MSLSKKTPGKKSGQMSELGKAAQSRKDKDAQRRRNNTRIFNLQQQHLKDLAAHDKEQAAKYAETDKKIRALLKAKAALKKVSPKKVSPKKVSPKKVSPKKVSPKKVSPKKVSPKKVSPKKVSPKKVSPKNRS